MSDVLDALFRPIQIGHLRLRNRIINSGHGR